MDKTRGRNLTLFLEVRKKKKGSCSERDVGTRKEEREGCLEKSNHEERIDSS